MNVDKLTAMASKLSISQLQQAMRDGSLPPYVGMPILQQKAKEAQAMKNAQGAAQPKPPTVAEQVEGEAQQANIEDMMRQRAAMMQGQMAGTGGISDMLRKPEPEAMAKGGAVAFGAGGDVGDIYEKLANGEPLTAEEQKLISGQNKMVTNTRYPWLGKTPAMVPANMQQTPATPAQAQQISPVIRDAVIANNPKANIGKVQAVQGAGTPVPREQPNVMTPPAMPAQEYTDRPPVTVAGAMKEWSDIVGENKGISALQGRLDKLDTDTAKEKDRAFSMALMNAGLGMLAGDSVFPWVNVGRGAQQGLQSYKEDMKDLRKADEKIYDLQGRIEDAKRSEVLAAAKYGADSKKAYDAHLDAMALQDRQDKAAWDRAVLSANTQRDVASTYSAKYGAKGELTPAQLFKARNEAAKIVDASLAKDLNYIMLSDEQQTAIREQKILAQMQYTTTGNFNGAPGPVNTGEAPALIPGFKLVGKQ